MKIILFLAIGLIVGVLILSSGLFQKIFWVKIAKPVIYLYPETTQTVTISLETDGDIFVSDPQIKGNSWTVMANPSGDIVYEGEHYPYLFYESLTAQKFNLDEGWVIPRSDMTPWFGDYLPKFGLNEAETSDFVEYWGVNLPDSEYYLISLINVPSLERATKLVIEPEPDTLIRVILLIKPLDAPVEIPEPEIDTPERKGFVAVEWGVVLQ